MKKEIEKNINGFCVNCIFKCKQENNVEIVSCPIKKLKKVSENVSENETLVFNENDEISE